MEIKILTNDTIKLTLSNKNMKEYDLNYNILQNNKSLTKNIVLRILDQIKSILTISATKNKLLLQSFKTKDKGCTIYINRYTDQANEQIKNKSKSIKTPIIAVFQSLTNMKNLCKNIYSTQKELDIKSELYKLNEEFIIIIYVEEHIRPKIVAFVKEFGKIDGVGYIKQKIVKEHCKLIFKNSAIEKMANHKPF